MFARVFFCNIVVLVVFCLFVCFCLHLAPTLPQKSFKLTFTQADITTWKTADAKESRLYLNAARKVPLQHCRFPDKKK